MFYNFSFFNYILNEFIVYYVWISYLLMYKVKIYLILTFMFIDDLIIDSDIIILKKMKNITVIVLFFFLICANFSSVEEEKNISVTIYNNNFAMVKDVRKISFDKGNSFLYFTDVSSNIQTETVTFKPLNSSASIRVYEQNFEKNLINKNSILQRYI